MEIFISNRLSNRGKITFYLVLDLVKNDFLNYLENLKFYSIIALFLVSGWYNIHLQLNLLKIKMSFYIYSFLEGFAFLFIPFCFVFFNDIAL